MTDEQEIKSSLRNLVIEALAEIGRRVVTEGVSSRNVPRIKFESGNRISMSEYAQPDFSIHLGRVESMLIKEPHFERFRAALLAHDHVRPHLNTLVGSPAMRRRLSPEDILRAAVQRQLENITNAIVFREDVFEDTCSNMFFFFTTTTLQVQCSAFLERFETQVERVELEPHLILRRLLPAEIEELWNRNSWFRDYYPFWSARVSSFPTEVQGVVEYSAQTEKVIGELSPDRGKHPQPTEVAHIEFERVLTALRLIKLSGVRYGPIVTTTPHLFDQSSSFHRIAPTMFNWFGDNFRLEAADIPSLLEIWKMLKMFSSSKNGGLEIGLRRFGFAAERINPEDRLLDATIALEALVLTDVAEPQERGELTYRLSVRVAHLLGKEGSEMKEIFKNVKKIYGLRSKIVHGGSLSPTESQFAEMALEYCRKTANELLMYVSKSQKPEWESWLFE